MYSQRIKKKKKNVKIVCPNQVPVATPIPSVPSEYNFSRHFQAAYNLINTTAITLIFHYLFIYLFIYTVVKQCV